MITYQEAAERLDNILPPFADDKDKVSIRIAQAAISKQIPSGAVERLETGKETLGRNYFCKCGNMWTIPQTVSKYCPECGQRLREYEEDEENGC